MPFKSAKQMRYLFAKHPEIARRWVWEQGGQFASQGGAGQRVKEAQQTREQTLPKKK